uniref:Variant surface glycoprotein 1125.1227 n=1 Tax=Trypanosoma brucei TaxID=5691 RepID=M4SZN8_9TRYP|nr:variant surface glycoprotein 1236 [Trypanosoma brucei]APD73466.1 variant surface glycoprotein 1125.1227 [Trypanosoma brucei]
MLEKILTLLLVAFVAFMTSPAQAADVAKGSNAESYAVLCTLVQLTKGTKPSVPKSQIIDDIYNVAAAIDLAIRGNTVVKICIEKKDSKYSDLTDNDIAKKFYTEQTWPVAQAGAAKLANSDEKEKYAVWTTRRYSEKQKLKVHVLTAAIINIKQRKDDLNKPDKLAKLTKALNNGLYGAGKTNADSATLPASGTHVTMCGNAEGETGGAIVGTALKFDLICLCGKQTSDTGTGQKACHDFPSPPATAIANNANINTDWASIEAGCKTVAGTPSLTPESIHAALQTFYKHGGVPKGDNHNRYVTIGKPVAASKAGCDGIGGSTGGKCAAYNKAQFEAGTGPYWATQMKAAAETLVELRGQEQKLAALEAETLALNASLDGMKHDEDTASDGGKSTPAVSATKAAENACEQAKSEEECTNLKAKGCAFDHKGDDGKKCTLSEEAKQAVEKQQQE